MGFLKENQSIFWVLMTSVLSAGMVIMTHSLNGEVHWSVVVFTRSVSGFIITISIALILGVKLYISRNKYIIARSLIGGIGIIFSFFAAYYLKPSDSIILFQTGPLWLIVFSMIFIGFRPSKIVLFACVISMCGIFIITKPNINFNSLATFFAIFAGIAKGLVMFVVTRMRRFSTYLIVLHFLSVAIITSSVAVSYFNCWPQLTLSFIKSEIIFTLLGIGFIASFIQIAFTKAFQTGTAEYISALSYISIVFAVIFQYLFWGYSIDMECAVGIILIVCSSLTIVLYKDRKRSFMTIVEIENIKIKAYWSEEEIIKLNTALDLAEAENSCEIIIHIENNNAIRSQNIETIYKKLNIGSTFYGNGVLIFINTEKNKISVVADSRIMNRYGKKDIEKLSEKITKIVNDSEFSLSELLPVLGKELGEFYPEKERVKNVLPNIVSIGNM
jgi:drug/metabolite transporter (DMT)-like permease